MFSLERNLSDTFSARALARIDFGNGFSAVEITNEGWHVFHGPVLVGRCGLRMDIPRVIARHKNAKPKCFGKREW